MKLKLFTLCSMLTFSLSVIGADKVFLSCSSSYNLKKDGSDTYTCKSKSKIDDLKTPSSPSGYTRSVSSNYDFKKVTTTLKDGKCKINIHGKKWRKCSGKYGCYKSNCSGYANWHCANGYTSTQGDGRNPSSTKTPCKKEKTDYKKGSCSSGYSYKKNYSGNTDYCYDKEYDYARPSVSNK